MKKLLIEKIRLEETNNEWRAMLGDENAKNTCGYQMREFRIAQIDFQIALFAPLSKFCAGWESIKCSIFHRK